jgi:glycosyltransferase involved in cell wall biosynthesis
MLHAPNVHTGGGLVLLRAVLAVPAMSSAWMQLDRRAADQLAIPPGFDVRYVAPSIISRLAAEWRLWRASRADSLVLCFHGMPPWFPVRGKVVVFQQNRHLVGVSSLAGFPFKVALRIGVERLICRLFRGHVDEYVVQTPSMARALARWHGGSPSIRLLLFSAAEPTSPVCDRTFPTYDFIYVASGDAHKNHQRLLDAWVLLAADGLFPKLALTVEAGNDTILRRLATLRAAHGIRVDNLPELSRECVFRLYRSSRALIFPSTSESLGLPLLEAAACGLPIVAAERDFVRDVAIPVETFDPESAVSIARAVRRFLGWPEPALPVLTANHFLARILHP